MPFDFSALMSLTDDGNRLAEILTPLLNRNQFSTAGAIDPFSDINAFKVNPSRGVLMQEGGVVNNGDPTFPAWALGKSYEAVPTRAEIIAESLGMDIENFRRFRNAVAWHESAHTLDPNIKQIGGGPGRGLFQFEPDAAKDAAVRLEALYKKEGVPPPEFVYRLLDKKNTSPDASTLTPEEQEELLVGQMIHLDKQKNPKLYKAFKKDLTDDETLKDVWFTYHNKSSSDKSNARKTSFDKSITYLRDNNFDLSDINIFDVSTDDNDYRYANEFSGRDYDPAKFFKGVDMLTTYGTPAQHLTNLPVKSSKLVNKIPIEAPKSDSMMLTRPINAFAYKKQGPPPRAQMGMDIMNEQAMLFSPEPPQRELGMIPQFPQDMYPYQRPALPMEIALPMMYYGGEVDKAFLGKLVKGIGKGIAGIGKGLFEGVKGIGDFGLGLIGAPDVIKDTFVDRSKFLSGANNVLGGLGRTALDVFVPGAGSALGMIGGAINPKQQAQMPEMGFDPSQFGYDPGVSDMPMPQSGMGLQGMLQYARDHNVSFQGVNNGFNPLSMFGGQGNMTGGFMGGNPMGGVPMGGMQMGNAFGGGQGGGLMNLLGGLLGGQGGGQGGNLMGLLGGLLGGNRMYGGRIYKNGGWVIPTAPLQGIQTESFKGVPERIIFPDANIGKVNATTTHEKMSEDKITDFIQEGSYVASSRPNMAFTRDELSNIVLGYKNKTYKTEEVVGVPEVITAADILKSGEKKIVPSMYADRIAKTYPTVENHDDDIFNKAANQYNLEARIPYINVLHQLGERNKQVAEFRNGGFAYGVPQAAGGFLAKALPIAGNLLSGLLGGGANRQNRIDPISSGLMMGSLPLSAIGISQNIRSQREALDRGMSELDTLTADQRRLNQTGVGVGALSTLMQETNLPDINMDFSRLQNFRTQTPQSFIDAAAAPVTDYRSLMDRLGSRAAVSAMANSEAASMQARNQAAADAFGRDREMQFNIENQITQGMNQQEVMNNQIAQQELAMRNNVIGNVGSQIQGGLQNEGTIMASAFQNRRLMDMQRAMLAGQANMANAQNMMNLGATRASIRAGLPAPQMQMQQPPNFQYSRASQPAVANRDEIMGMLGQATATSPNFVPPNLNVIGPQLGQFSQFNPQFNQNIGLNPMMSSPLNPLMGRFGRGG